MNFNKLSATQMPSYDKSSILDKDIVSKSSISMRKTFYDNAGRQRSNSADSEHSVEAYVMRSKKAAGYLRQILHSQRCENQCHTVGCMQTTKILKHVRLCEAAICGVAGCETTKKLLLHYEQCKSKTACRVSSHVNSTCLICSIACSSSPTKQLVIRHNTVENTDLSRMVNSPNQPNTVISNQEDQNEDEEDDGSFSSDEVITFNRVPFQNNQVAARVKTYSDSDFAVPVGAPKSALVKARSKSMNAMCTNELTST